MLFLILIWIVLIGVCFGAAYAVYVKLQRLGKNPWPLAIITFILTGALILGGLFAFFLATWER